MTSTRVLGWTVGVFLAATIMAQVNNRPSGLLAITRVAVIDTAKGSVARDMTVVIRGDRIVSSEARGTVPKGAEVIDGQNRFLVPGFWDMHVHLSYARVSALEALVANGVTGVRDLGSDLAELDRWRTLKLPLSGHIPMTVSPAEASDAGQASIEHTETLFEGVFATQNAGKDMLAAMTAWRMTEAPALFDKFSRNGTMVDPTLIAQMYLVQLVDSGTPDPRARYIAASARKEADKTLGPEARKALLGRKDVLREVQIVTGLMNRHGVALLAGTDLSYVLSSH